MFEIFDLCGKQYEFMPYGIHIALGFVAISFIFSLFAFLGNIKYLGASFILLFIAGGFIYKDKQLKEIMLIDAINNVKCIDPILENYNIFSNIYEDKAILVTKIKPENILQYSGKNKLVLMDIYRRYSYGVNGLPKDDRLAKKAGERLGY